MLTLTKHARERYRERFGVQSDKIIIERAGKAVEYGRGKDGVSYRAYGAICFAILEDSILTVMKRDETNVKCSVRVKASSNR